MQFDRYTITLLELRPDAPELDESAAEELQSAHLAHLAELHDRGVLIAAGPLLGDAGRVLRGLSIWNAPPDEVQRIVDEHPDPAVVAGRFCVRVIPWMTPAHAIVAAQSRFPRSVAEAQPD